MNKNTPKIIFTGLAVAAAGVLGAVATGTVPQALLSQLPAQTTEQVPAQQPAAQPKVEEAPAAAESQPAQPAAPAQQSASADPQAAVQTPASAPEPAAETAPAAVKIQDRFPSFDTVRVDPTGDAVIAGHAAPGSEVTIKFAGQEVGKATANADGSFVFVPDKPLPAGAGALSLEAVVNGEKVASADQVAIVVQAQQQPALVAKVDPAQPTQIVQSDASGAPPKDVEISAVDYDDQGNILFQGRVPVGNIVRFYVDNTAIGDARPDDKGHWLFKGTTPIAPGTHTLRADEVDAAGKVVSRAETPFLREAPEKVAAAAAAASNATPEAAPAQTAAAGTADAATPAADAAPGTQIAMTEPATALASGRIVIQPGNNLWRISRLVYGKGRLYTVIWEANRNQIRNPNKVYPGQILTAPKS